MKTLCFVHALLLALGISVTSVPIASAKTPWLMPAEEDPLPAETQQQIRTLVNEGVAASAKNDWEGARAALLKAWEIRPLATIAANLGYVELKLGKYREAAEHLQYFLVKAPADRPERRADAEQQLAECHKHIAIISVKANVDGAQLTMDASEVGQTPLTKQLFVEPGMHTFKASRPGYQSELRTISVEADRDVVLQFTLQTELNVPKEPAAAAQSASTENVAAERPGIQPRTWFLIGGSAATAISLGVGIAYRLKAGSLGDDASSTLAQIDSLPDTTSSQRATSAECFNRTGTAQTLCEQLWATRRQQDSSTNTSTAAFVTAGVLGVATAVTYFLWPEPKSSAKRTSAVSLRFAPLSLGSTRGVQIFAAF
jgi:hypothetical protein